MTTSAPMTLSMARSVLGVQVAPSAAERQARDADGGHDTEGRGQPESLRFPVEFSELESRLGAHDPPDRIDAYALHRGQIDHMPPSQTDLPATLWPPPRTATRTS